MLVRCLIIADGCLRAERLLKACAWCQTTIAVFVALPRCLSWWVTCPSLSSACCRPCELAMTQSGTTARQRRDRRRHLLQCGLCVDCECVRRTVCCEPNSFFSITLSHFFLPFVFFFSFFRSSPFPCVQPRVLAFMKPVCTAARDTLHWSKPLLQLRRFAAEFNAQGGSPHWSRRVTTLTTTPALLSAAAAAAPSHDACDQGGALLPPAAVAVLSLVDVTWLGLALLVVMACFQPSRDGGSEVLHRRVRVVVCDTTRAPTRCAADDGGVATAQGDGDGDGDDTLSPSHPVPTPATAAAPDATASEGESPTATDVPMLPAGNSTGDGSLPTHRAKKQKRASPVLEAGAAPTTDRDGGAVAKLPARAKKKPASRGPRRQSKRLQPHVRQVDETLQYVFLFPCTPCPPTCTALPRDAAPT